MAKIKISVSILTGRSGDLVMRIWKGLQYSKLCLPEVFTIKVCVLGSARTGLIFTRSQEGTQPGRLTQPGQTEQGIPYHVLPCWVLVGGRWAAERQLRLSRWWAVRVLRSTVLFCVFSLFVSLFLFPLFAVLLNCPYPDPSVFACFFPFSSTPQRGKGGRATAWPFLLPATVKL